MERLKWRVLISSNQSDTINSINTLLQSLGDVELLSVGLDEVLKYASHTDLDLILIDLNDLDQDRISRASSILDRFKVQSIFFTLNSACNASEDSGFNIGKGFFFPSYTLSRENLYLSLTNALNTRLSEDKLVESDSEVMPFLLKQNRHYIPIPPQDLLFIQSDGNYCYLITREKKYIVRGSLKRILKKLPSARFLQVHKQYIIRVDLIDRLDMKELKVYYKYGESFPIGRSYRDQLLSVFTLI
ncbi:MAG: LytTR family transcriptional regulator [Bacteroidetes bacterium]|nr:LytTR family transcriptional regulator [Bacteroidota bacterium]